MSGSIEPRDLNAKQVALLAHLAWMACQIAESVRWLDLGAEERAAARLAASVLQKAADSAREGLDGADVV